MRPPSSPIRLYNMGKFKLLSLQLPSPMVDRVQETRVPYSYFDVNRQHAAE